MATSEVLGGRCDIHLTRRGLMPDRRPARDVNVAEKRYNKEQSELRSCKPEAAKFPASTSAAVSESDGERTCKDESADARGTEGRPTKERAAVVGQQHKGHRNITGCHSWNPESAGQEKLTFRQARGRSG